MKKIAHPAPIFVRDFIFVLAFTFCALTVPHILSAAEFHVSPSGSDENAGTLDAPFATLEKARDAVRALNRPDGEEAVIHVHAGDYYLARTIEFGKEDQNLRISGWKNELPRFFGGLQVKNWKKSNFRGLPNVYEADLAEIGVSNRFRQLFYGGVRQIWCRYPNYDARYPFSGGWAYVDGKVFGMYQDVPGERCDLVQVKETDFRNWEKPSEGVICLFPRYNWWNVAFEIKETDPEKKTITLTKAMQYAARPADRYHLMGLREELDAPGEWYQDVEARKLYFIPPDEKLLETSVTIPVPNGIFALKECKNVTFSGLDLCGAENFGVKMDNCEACTVEKSLLHDMIYFHGAAVEIRGGRECQVLGCNVWNSGGHGLSAQGGDRKTLTECRHNLENNYIHHCGQLYRHGIGTIIYGIGVRVAHNRMHDLPRCGIFHGGQKHTIEFNDIDFTNLEMEDTAAIYGGGWTGGLGTVIRFNSCTNSIGFGHDSKGDYHFHMFAWGIYLDEACCGTDVYGNFVKGCQAGAMHLHCARENHITNNIFVSNAGLEGKTRQMSCQGWNDAPNGYFLRVRQAPQLKEYEALVNANPDWKKLRGNHISPAEPFLEDGTIMRGNRFLRNIYYYPDQPEATYMTATNFNFEANEVDRNVVYAGGAPIRTGKNLSIVKPDAKDLAPGLVPNVNFTETVPEEELNKSQTLSPAAKWNWYHPTRPRMPAEIVTNDEGKKALRIQAAFNPENRYIKNSCIRSTPFQLTPGTDYCLRFRLRTSEDMDGHVTARCVSENGGLWKPFGIKGFFKSGICETSFRFPKEGEKDFDPRLGPVTIQFEKSGENGWFELSDIQIFDAKVLNEWDSWQNLGADKNSITEDPMFVNPAGGNYQLKPESPALKLGFEPIPFEKIGPYESEKRVTWPIVKVPGALENPHLLEIPPKQE